MAFKTEKRLRILLVTPCSPFASQCGAQQRTALLHDALEQLGDTDILIVSPTKGPSYVKPSKDPRIRLEYFWQEFALGYSKYEPEDFQYPDSSVEPLDFRGYDLIVGRYLNPICKLPIPSDIPKIVDLDDWGKTYGPAGIFSLGRAYQRFKKDYAYWLARKQLSRFDGFFFVSKRDRSKEPRVLGEVLPNIPFFGVEDRLPDEPSKNIVFVGALWYAPNAYGIDRFLANCWPQIRSRVPEVTLTLVGAAPVETRAKWEETPGVRAAGYADDLIEAYRSAAFSIAPIYFGGGTNIKILESLGFGRACITTPHGAEAFQDDLVAKDGLAVATSDTEFAELCIAMLNNQSARTRLALRGFELVKAHYCNSRFTEAVCRLVEATLARRG